LTAQTYNYKPTATISVTNPPVYTRHSTHLLRLIADAYVAAGEPDDAGG